VRAWFVAVLAGCSSPSPHVSPPEPPEPTPSTPSVPSGQRGTLRIAPKMNPDRFYGVWLERADGSRWIVDYRARALWTSFADREVVVTGECYQPKGHAILGTHFRILTLRPLDPAAGQGPYLAIGPERALRGELARVAAPPGSKLAGSSRLVFKADDGTTYNALVEREPALGRTTLYGRVVEPDMSHHARMSGPDLWIVDRFEAGDDGIPPPATPCPG